MNFHLVILFFSAISFIIYGISSFYSKRMISEYERWGYQKHRIQIAILQLLAGLGLLIVSSFPLLLALISSSLFIMMMVAVFVRIKIKDTIINTLPAVFYATLNFIIFYDSLNLYLSI